MNDKLDDSKLFAQRCEERADEIGSFIYKFLAILMQLKADITASNIEKQSEKLKKLKDAVNPLKSEKLEHIIQVGMRVYSHLIKYFTTKFGGLVARVCCTALNNNKTIIFHLTTLTS